MAIITISRGTFSGGKAVAERLAERLGYPCVSREVILDAANEYGISEEKLTTALKEPPHFWQQNPSKRIAYLSFVTAALLDRAKEGQLVYHGHAGHLLLAGISHVLRVRVIADMEFRVRAATERTGLSREQAIVAIEKVDKERMKWTRFLYGVEWQDASLYDVVLNLEKMSVESASETVVRMTELDDFKPTAASQKAFDNLMLASRVWAALTKDSRTKGANVRVRAESGVVTIWGSAQSESTLEAIP
ncbi:MAG: cytidylate kinase family protein, partial [Deltaproteobacteria bacterium]|nr:cytidylate kinase family protein [Deltaproteobacteria bacterium]